MILLLGLWLLIAAGAVATGSIAIRVTGAATLGSGFDALCQRFWCGLGLLALLHLGVALVLPLGIAVGLAILGTTVVAAAALPGPRREILREASAVPWAEAAALGGAAVLAAWFASGLVVYFDTGYYHIQMAQLLADFGTLQGAAWIHPNYGLVSSWFALSAPWTDGWFRGRAVGAADGLVTAVLMAQMAVALLRWSQRRAGLADIVLGLAAALLLLFVLRWHMAAAMTPDLPVLFLVLAVGWMLLLDAEAGSDRSAGPENRAFSRLVLLIAVGAAGMKPSAIPLLGLGVIFMLARHRFAPSAFLRLATIGAVTAAPLLAASFMASGCLAYPLVASCVETSWTLPLNQVAGIANLVQTAAGPGGSGYATSAFEGPFDRLWYFVSRDRSSAALFALFFAGCAGAAFAMKRKEFIRLRWPIALSVTGTLFVLYASSVGRFGGSYSVLLPALATGLVLARLSPAQARLTLPRGLAVAALCLWIAIAFAGRTFSPPGTISAAVHAKLEEAGDDRLAFPARLAVPVPVIPFRLFPAPPIEIGEFEQVRRNGVPMWLPHGVDCWAVDPPCAKGGGTFGLEDPAAGVSGGLIRPEP